MQFTITDLKQQLKIKNDEIHGLKTIIDVLNVELLDKKKIENV